MEALCFAGVSTLSIEIGRKIAELASLTKEQTRRQ
jgi:hypothetical protein